MSRRKKKNNNANIINTVLILIFCILLYTAKDDILKFASNIGIFENNSYAINEIPYYNGEDFVVINNNTPNFEEKDYELEELESYSNLDTLKRCGVAFAIVGKKTMPKEERGSIGMIKPSGWHTVKYDIVDGKYLYNRCHLIGFQLTGENANEKNLITCTRQMNTGVMLEYENKVAKYIKETNNHVLYRVTPIFEGANLVASGVEIEASSKEDKGKSLSFHIYIYNVQDGITINYENGKSSLAKK